MYVILFSPQVPLVILGDPAYPSLPWLMKPYQETANMTRGPKLYNYCQSRARMVVENAFGRLKGHWRCLLKRLDFNLENVSHVVAPCVVLHNTCEMYGDTCLAEWTDHTAPDPPISDNVSIIQEDDGANVCNAIMKFLSTTI